MFKTYTVRHTCLPYAQKISMMWLSIPGFMKQKDDKTHPSSFIFNVTKVTI